MGRLIGANAAIGGFSLASLSVTRPSLITETIGSILRRLADGDLGLEVTQLDGLREVPDAHQALATGTGATKYVARLAPAAT